MNYHATPIWFDVMARHLDQGYYAVPASYPCDFVLDRDEEDDEIIPDSFVFLSDDEDEANRMLALRVVTDDFQSDIDVISGKSFEIGRAQYLVVTDDEADRLYDDYLDNYIDENVLSEIPEHYHRYFDTKRYKEDAKIDGRGHHLAHHDGDEQFATIGNETWYLYQQS